jgi:hypothetical protein
MSEDQLCHHEKRSERRWEHSPGSLSSPDSPPLLHHSATAIAAAFTTPNIDRCDVAVASLGRIRPGWVVPAPLEHHRSGDQQDRRQRALIEPSGHRWSLRCADCQASVVLDRISLLLPLTCARMVGILW